MSLGGRPSERRAIARVRTGVFLDSDGWRVVQALTHPDGTEVKRVYDPPFPTVAEVEEAAKVAAQTWRDVLNDRGIHYESRGVSGE